VYCINKSTEGIQFSKESIVICQTLKVYGREKSIAIIRKERTNKQATLLDLQNSLSRKTEGAGLEEKQHICISKENDNNIR
jgi:hypothetical protein